MDIGTWRSKKERKKEEGAAKVRLKHSKLQKIAGLF